MQRDVVLSPLLNALFKGNTMSGSDWFQVIFLAVFVSVSVGGFVWVAMKKD
ncbi:MAG: hypothetical protein AB7U44_04160 [Sulfuricurvum sp.]|uniref:hypothetical protein n=1 Tax=Sulfuricurvum sp. TaxID=2025608 RepID=UPI002605F37A|nr:hypothetical protein [Sulfuricurvum sp.]MDD2838203.1 hypothetical protein [Sulfuricurvum sp.]MDD3598433.1 hypothetical protein [Sulfuricurvum sp.]